MNRREEFSMQKGFTVKKLMSMALKELLNTHEYILLGTKRHSRYCFQRNSKQIGKRSCLLVGGQFLLGLYAFGEDWRPHHSCVSGAPARHSGQARRGALPRDSPASG